MLAAMISSVFSLVGAFMPEYVSYTATRCPSTSLGPSHRLVTAIGAQGIFQMVFAMSVEITGIK